MNTNQLFKWRRQMLADERTGVAGGGPMVPVEIAANGEVGSSPVDRAGVIEIAFRCGARVCVRGSVAPEALRQVIEVLARR